MAVNRLTASGSVAEHAVVKLIEEAKALLAERLPDRDGEHFQGDNVSCELFADADFKGASLFVNLPPGGTFTGFENLSSVHFNDKISSLRTQCSTDEVAGASYLFQNKRYDGMYLMTAMPGGSTISLPALGAINDRASSVLLFRRFSNEVELSLGDFITAVEVSPLVDAQPHLSTRNDPIVTWDLFPDGTDGHPNVPWLGYVWLRLPVTVHPPHWAWDYDAEIRYWINLFVDAEGNLQGSLDFYGAWVESGLIAGDIYSDLMGSDGIVTSLGQVSSLISGATGLANIGAPFSQVYLLPGHNAIDGQTSEGVTVVLVKGKPIPPPPIQ